MLNCLLISFLLISHLGLLFVNDVCSTPSIVGTRLPRMLLKQLGLIKARSLDDVLSRGFGLVCIISNIFLFRFSVLSFLLRLAWIFASYDLSTLRELLPVSCVTSSPEELLPILTPRFKFMFVSFLFSSIGFVRPLWERNSKNGYCLGSMWDALFLLASSMEVNLLWGLL